MNDLTSPFSIDKIAECFPFDTFRESQEEVLEDIIASFNSGVDVILFRGDVGFGKSPIGICLSRMTDKKKIFIDSGGSEQIIPFGSYYTTPQKILQDQLARDFGRHINIVKGRASYMCTVLPGNTCKDGLCQFDTKFKCEEECEYKIARNAAANGQICCGNLMYMIVVPKFLFGSRQLLIVDEVHSINDWALNHVGCVLKQRDVDGAIPKYKTYNEYIKWLGVVHLKLSNKYIELDTRLQELEDGGNQDFALGIKEARDAVGIVFSKVGLLLKDHEDTGEEWIWQIEDEGKKTERIKFEPITAGRFLDQIIWWRGEKKLLMSGTIFPELFIEEAGLTDKVCEYMEMPSIFPKENRPIFVWPAGKMTLRERENTIPKMIERIADIADKYPSDKGIVHCGSYQIAQDLYDGVVETLGEDKVMLQDRTNREGSLREWMESDEPVLFFSINMTEGLDLKNDLCRYQIVAKIQFPYLGDKRIKARMKMVKYTCDKCGKNIRTVRDLKDTMCKCGEGKMFIDMDIQVNYCSECGKRLISGANKIIESDTCSCGNKFTKNIVTIDGRYWYDAKAIIDLIQTYGRPVRTPTDHADCWILDSSFVPLYRKRYQTFPKMFKECVKMVK